MWKPLVVLALVASTAAACGGSKGKAYGPYPANCGHHHHHKHRKCHEPNKVYDPCPNPCPPRECGIDKALILCAPPPKPGSKDCKPGCRCADGFLKNRAGVCIPEDECQYDCAKNETLDECYSGCPPRYCGVNIAAVSCLAINESDCEPGCRCSDGYSRNAEGYCILDTDCPQCPKQNEVYDVCPAPCPPRRCDVDETLIDCKPGPQPGDPECEPGCRCADGFVRNPEGDCVTRDQCPNQCTGPNEEYDICPAPCPPQRCGVDPSVIRCAAPPQPGDPDCEPGCRCIEGFVRNPEGVCVTPDQCPQCTGPNEEYDICPAPCPPQRCGVDPSVIRCAAPPQPGDPDCEPGCRCIDGYVRNDDGICVTRDECPQNCKGKHEIYSQCPAWDCRPQNCSQVGIEQPCLIPGPDSSSCPGEPGCICDSDYVRNSRGKCIKTKKCPTCGGDPNAISGCGTCVKSCSNYNSTKPIVCAKICKINSCDCKKGFVLDDSTGKCICPDQCVSCGGDFNAKRGCDKNCTKRCPGPKPAECKCYKDGCTCKDGFVYDTKANKCVRLEQCTPPCGNNEVLSNCSNSGCGPLRCTDVGMQTKCFDIDQEDCIVDCVCQDGYVRDENEVCVPVTDCPSCGGDPNAVSGCGNCVDTCSDYNSTEPKICLLFCKLNGCNCRKGFVLDESTGKCIHPKKCVSCGGDFNAKRGCDKNCTKRCPGPKPAECKCYKDGCTCKDGFVYDPKANKCVRLEQCTPPCGNNEVLSNCSNGGCGPWRCTDVGVPTGCVKMDQKNCIVDCVCQDGYVRDDNEICVPVTDCPTCGGDPNAVSGCGNCVKRCSNYNSTRPMICPEYCELNGCDCRKGFVLDDDSGLCIRPSKCGKCTGANEMYDPCPPTCPPQTCESIGRQYSCPLMPANKTSKDCRGACRCKPNYLRNKNGECIPAKDCPLVCKKNEVYSECTNGGCEARNCSQLGQPVPCVKLDPKYCIKGCVCEEGYLRARNGTCVPEDKCDNCNKPHEYYDSCAPSCPPQTCDSIGRTIECPITAAVCKGACRCDKGYFRNKKGECILKKDCPPVCKKHEVYSECTNGGCEARNCSQLGQPVPCVKMNPKYCLKGCVCEEGYLRARNGTCVPQEKCDNCNKPHEHYDSCAPSCPPQTCDSIGRTIECPITAAVCKGACRCDKGYFRNENGECILEKDCFQCTKPHEVYDPCPYYCPPQTCAAIGVAYPCAPPPVGEEFCNPACRCEDGYYRNSIDECISEEDCSKCTGPNEHYTCGGACDNVCATLSTQNQTNCPFINKKCNLKCYCDKGYARDENDICIPIEQCGVSCRDDPNAIPGGGGNCGNRCSDYNKEGVACILIYYIDGCECKQGYVYDDNLEMCVLPEDCSPVCGYDEVYSTCINGGCQKKTCSDLGRPDICVNPIECIDGCLCKEGFLRDENGTCVPNNECPIPVCQKNEVFDGCANGGCRRRTCSDLTGGILCIDPIECMGGCICAEGFLRNEDGVCVAEKECNPKCYGPHEVFEFCPYTCPPRTCESLDRAYICPIVTGQEPPCEPSCVCEEGYYRNILGECISEANCLKCTGPHEYFSCGGACDNVCTTLSVRNQTSCPIINIKCNEKCYCEDGYARNGSDICIPIEECPVTCYGDHKVFNRCPRTCPPQTCESLNNVYICYPETGEEEPPCEPGCVCEDGYYENAIGECLTREECLKCNGPNEYYSCGVECDNVCETLNEQSQADCPIVNIQCNKMCYCEEGYARNASKICIPIEDCPPSRCGPNERYEESPSRVCDPLTCSEVGQEMDCPPLEYDDCVDTPGCICKYGFVRNDDDVCIPISECPDDTAVNVTDARARLDQGSISLSGKMLYYLVSKKPDENCVASASSLLIPMAQLALFAKDSVLKELLKLLNLRSKEEIKACFLGLKDEFSNQTHVEFEVATKYYANELYKLSPDFIRDSDTYFGADGENVDFSKIYEVAKIINDWVSNRTRGKIQNLVTPDMFSADTRLCLVNAIYFLGNWVKQFDPSNTETKDFYKSNGETTQLKIMYQQNTFNYAENDKFQVLEMFYKGGNYSFVVVLPRNKTDLQPTLKTLEDPVEWIKMMESLSPQKCNVYLPVMTIETLINVKQFLTQNGGNKIFDPMSNGFEGILEVPEPVFISDAVQKAFIKVNELGTEAAAATAITVGITSVFNPSKTYEFVANRPFAYSILYRSADSPYKMPVFSGSFVGAE